MAALALGAVAVNMGTRFVATDEAPTESAPLVCAKAADPTGSVPGIVIDPPRGTSPSGTRARKYLRVAVDVVALLGLYRAMKFIPPAARCVDDRAG